MAEIIKEFEKDIESFKLIPTDGGKFEVSINGKLIYSKLHTSRHALPGEVIGLIKEKY